MHGRRTPSSKLPLGDLLNASSFFNQPGRQPIINQPIINQPPNKQKPIMSQAPSVSAGNIAAVQGLASVRSGDTLLAGDAARSVAKQFVLPGFDIPPAVFALSVEVGLGREGRKDGGKVCLTVGLSAPSPCVSPCLSLSSLSLLLSVSPSVSACLSMSLSLPLSVSITYLSSSDRLAD
jgi:hypothetical protein